MGWMASAVQAVLAATAAFAAFAVVSNRHSIFKAIPNEWRPMKVSKIDLGKNVENRIELLTPNCRKQKSKLGKNVENHFLTVSKG